MNIWFIVAACLFVLVAVSMMLLIKSAPMPIAKPTSVSAALKHPKKKKRKTSQQEKINEWWLRAGFSTSRFINVLLILLIIMVGFLGFVSMSSFGALVGVSASIFILFLLAQWRRAKFQRRVTNLMPSFIDQVNRRIQVGISLPRAIEQSTKTTPKPLSTILERVNQRRQLGIELQDAFYKEWRITGVPSFQLLGSIFSVNARFGGSINDSLESVVQLLRQQDSSRRELSSLTGETRVTAWVIGVAPILVAGYMLSQNPTMLIDMWESDSGRPLLMFAGGLELMGIIIIWRMLKSL
ncbi:type II secretion system F family protein [Vibrio sp.]|uniref:type II secretion system F family protein n=1 Tax=Vibrio sp. TaxID=678 RepID=UPI003AA93D0D